MKIEQQVVSLELAKKLKEAGYPQDDSVWVWHKEKAIVLRNYLTSLGQSGIPETGGRFIIAAPSVAELGEILPTLIIKNNTKKYLCTFHNETTTHKDKRWSLWYGTRHNEWSATANTEANVRAVMVLYLLEQGLLKFPTHEKK